MKKIIWHNGVFKDNGPVFTAQDRVRLGDGVFDTMLAMDGSLIHADLHFSRILYNVILVGVDREELLGVEGLETIAQELLEHNKHSQGRYAINTIITRGPVERGLRTPEKMQPSIVMMSTPVPSEFLPVKAMIAQTVRRNEGSPLSQIKSLNYGDNILAIREAESRGANEAVLLNNAGHATCATTSNLFAVIDGEFVTPPLSDGVMNGVTRSLLMDCYDVAERSLTADDLLNAECLYLTNSIRGAVPVVELDGKIYPNPSLPIAKDFHLE